MKFGCCLRSQNRHNTSQDIKNCLKMWGSRYFLKSTRRSWSNQDCGHSFLLESNSRQGRISLDHIGGTSSQRNSTKLTITRKKRTCFPTSLQSNGKKLPSVMRNSLCQCNWRVRASPEREQQHTRLCGKLFNRKQPAALKSRWACSCVIPVGTHAHWGCGLESQYDCPILCYCATDWQRPHHSCRMSKRFGIL